MSYETAKQKHRNLRYKIFLLKSRKHLLFIGFTSFTLYFLYILLCETKT